MQARWNLLLLSLLIVVLVLIGLFADRFTVYLTSRVMILSIFALGYNLLLGGTGLLSFGHGAFYAAGVYGLGLFSLHVNPHPLAGIVVGVAFACLLAMVIGFFLRPAYRNLLCHVDAGFWYDGVFADLESAGYHGWR